MFVKPVAAPGPAESDARALAFLYDYIWADAPKIRVSAHLAWIATVTGVGGAGGSRSLQGPTSHLTPLCLMPALPQPLMRRMFPAGLGPLSSVPRTGPSPVMARVSEWLRVIPRWEGISRQVSGLCSMGMPGLHAPRISLHGEGVALQRACSEGMHKCKHANTVQHADLATLPTFPPTQMEADQEIRNALGWVREMYAFSLACAVERWEPEVTVSAALVMQPCFGQGATAALRCVRLGPQADGAGWLTAWPTVCARFTRETVHCWCPALLPAGCRIVGALLDHGARSPQLPHVAACNRRDRRAGR